MPLDIGSHLEPDSSTRAELSEVRGDEGESLEE